MKKFQDEEISLKKIDEILENFVNNQKINSSLDSLIINTISTQMPSSFSRKKIKEKVLNSDYLNEVEEEILDKICTELQIKPDHNNLKIKSKIKLEKISKPKIKNTSTINKELSIYASNQSVNMDSQNLLKILTEEFLSQNDMLKLENYIGDFSNFDSEVLITNEKIYQILHKIREFLQRYSQGNSKSSYLAPNVINFFHILLKVPTSNILVECSQIFLDYFKTIIDKFYKGPFDIEKFSDLSVNAQCLTNILMKFYEGQDILLSRIEDEKLFLIVEKLFLCVLSNYDDKNPIYFKENIAETQFGLSTNYILLILFCLDQSLSIFKILFRNSQMRKHLIQKFNFYRHLPFLDHNTCRKSFKVRFCFLWNHVSVLHQIFPNKKVNNKKFLVYSWVSIKMHFLGFILRYKSLRTKFYEELNKFLNDDDTEHSVNKNSEKESHDDTDSFYCFNHFKNVICFLIDVIFKDVPDELNDFEEYQKENLFYLIKEVLCDFVLYCSDKECIKNKRKFVNDLYKVKEYRRQQSFKYLLDDLVLAFKENVYD